MDNEKLVLLVFSIIYLPVFIFEFIQYLRNIERPMYNFKSFLKYNFYVLSITLVIILTLSHTNFLNYESPIPYKRINTISFKNFRGLELFKKELYGSKYFAYVVTSIDYEINDDSLSVQSFFHPSRSFVYNKNSGSKELLNHEIYHFKITEIYARKAKKEISEIKNITKFEIEDIINKTKVKEQEFQEKYDYDTFHSYVLKEQIKYEKNVDSLLYLLKNYKNPKIKINEKG
jgi:hypothetical protein